MQNKKCFVVRGKYLFYDNIDKIYIMRSLVVCFNLNIMTIQIH